MCVVAADVEAAEQFHWERTGWGGGGGFFASAWHPTKPNVIYMGGDVNGMLKSDDKGLHWRFINNGIASYGIYSIAISKSNPDTLLALCQSGGVCKSTDGGEHWQLLPETAPAKLYITGERPWTVRAVAIDPGNSQIFYAGSVATGRLYKSQDGGATWKKLDIENAKLAEAALEKPKITVPQKPKPAAGFPSHDGITELGSWNKGNAVMGWMTDNSKPFVTAIEVSREIHPAGRGKGGSLALLCDGEPGLNPPVGWAKRFFPVARDWRSAERLTARFYLPPDAPPLTAQIGMSCVDERWTFIGGELVTGKPGAWTDVKLEISTLEPSQRDFIRNIVFAVNAPKQAWSGKVYLADVFLHGQDKDAQMPATTQPAARGMAGAANFKNQGPGISSVAVAEKKPNLVLATSSELGVLRSEDGGATWTRVRSAPGAWSVSIAPGNPDIVYCCYNTDERMLKSIDGGKSWNYINNGVALEFTPREIAVHPTNPDIIHVVGNIGWAGMTSVSSDGGRTWGAFVRGVARDSAANPTLPDEAFGGSKQQAEIRRINNISINRSNPNELHIACGWVPSISLDGGKSWQERDRGADISCTEDIRFLPGGRDFVGCMDEGLLMSQDNGASWKQLFPLTGKDGISGHIWRVWPTKGGQRILAAMEPWGNYGIRVFISEDAGKSFQLVTKRLPSQKPEGPSCIWGIGAPRGLAVHPNDPNIMYLSIGGGIFKSADAGKSWAALKNQPPSRRSFMGLHLDPTDANRIYYGTTGVGGGLYRSDDAGNSWQHVFKQEPWILDFGVSPTGIVYCGQKNLYRSADHGQSWQRLTDFQEDRNICAVEFDPANEHRFWISRVTPGTPAKGGIWRTTDGGKSWTDITGDNPYVKPYILRFNPETGELWSGGVGLHKLKRP